MTEPPDGTPSGLPDDEDASEDEPLGGFETDPDGEGESRRGNEAMPGMSSFDAALEHGADMIEFDVRSWQGRLVVAHKPCHPGLFAVPTLDGALTHLAAPRFAGLELNADVKHPGVEAPLLDALARHGLAQRTLVSSQRRAVVERVRALDPSVRTGISVGGPLARRRQRWRHWRAHVLEAVGAKALAWSCRLPGSYGPRR